MTAEEIEADVKRRVALAMADAADEIAFDIESAYESAIDHFYKSLGPDFPKYYSRNYFTYTGSDSYKNYSKNVRVSDKDFTAGIHVGSEFVQGGYKDPTDYVFNRTFLEGIHGTIGTGGITTPPAFIMYLSFEQIKDDLGSYVKSALSKYL